jgi:2-(1,2-epoxy-1,2-dihydrophenyl)acetyl-CoA isomerase
VEYEDLLLYIEDGIATITLNAPHKLNAVTRGIGASLPLAVDEIAKDDDVRVVILTGAGRGFCAGADVSAMGVRMGDGEAVEVPRHARLNVLGMPTALLFPTLDKTVIAAINGPCAGMGFSIALSCDIRIASETAKFVAAQVARGLIPDVGMTRYLPLVVGNATALELMTTGRSVDATEAERLGIVSRVVAADELMTVARGLAAKIAKNPPIPVELTKRIVYRTLLDDVYRCLDLETWAQAICRVSEDHREGVMSFLEKRPPGPFKGK